MTGVPINLNTMLHPIHKLIMTSYGINVKDVHQMGECFIIDSFHNYMCSLLVCFVQNQPLVHLHFECHG